MNQYDFSGRTAVVTGGAQGIGYAIAERLMKGGARVVLWDYDAQALADAKARLGATQDGQSVDTFKVDISDADAVRLCAEQTFVRHARIDVLVNSAGVAGANATVVNYSQDEWRRVIDINLNGTFYVNQAIARNMIANNYGRIVNIASIAGKEGNPNASAYSASKAGVIGLTKSLGKELAQHNIAVNAVTPAAARTRIFDQMSQEHIDYMLSKIPRGRFLELDEAADMVAWLSTEENSFTTAAVFDLSGGRATY